MIMDQWITLVSIVLVLMGSSHYLYDTLKGKSKPNRVSWGMWVFAPLVATGAALSAGADLLATSRTFFAGFLPLIIFLASFINPKSYWELTRFDITCGALSLMGMGLWLVVGIPQIGLLFDLAGDMFAALPTFKKAWTNPETETKSTYLAAGLSSALILLVVPEWNIENAAFQVMLVAQNLIFIAFLYRKQIFRSQ